jgi:protein-S-isoprenylcysteine O-methyltransferase Ste14
MVLDKISSLGLHWFQSMTLQFLQISCFALLSFVLIYFSRKPLLNKSAHGFTRFFAWEAILALLVLHAPVWHDHMFSTLQMVSWTLLIISPILAWLGLRALKHVGKNNAQRQDLALYQFEKTEQLVTTSIYGFIRHPMYASLIFLAWGAYLKDITPLSTLLVAIASLTLWLTAKRDESECLAYFGAPYASYMKASKRFVPFLI